MGKDNTTKRKTKVKMEKKIFQEKLKDAEDKKSKLTLFLDNKGE